MESYPYLRIQLNYDLKQEYELDTRLYGEYNLENILAAICIGIDVGVPHAQIHQAVEEYEPINNRSQFVEFGATRLILDCYNANPTSMHQALSSFSKLKSDKKLVILGSMKELGDHSLTEHEKLIRLVKQYKFTKSIFIGPEFWPPKDSSFSYYQSYEDFQNSFNADDYSGFTVLVKGSRINKLERIAELFKTQDIL